MRKKYLTIILLLTPLILVFSILFLYYRGNRDSFINRTINNFSANNQALAVELKKLTKILDIFYIFHQFIPSQIPTYNLIIDPKDLAWLNSNLPETGTLTSQYKQAVPAQFIYQDKSYSAEVRYRGDNPNHWQFDKKSWRIKFDDQFENQTAINLILPEDRYFFIEPWVAHMGQKLGLVLPEFSLVNLMVNQELQGVYLKSEHWGEAFLTNHGLSPEANLYGEAEFDPPVPNLYVSTDNFKKYTSDPAQTEDDKTDLQALLDLINHASDDEFNSKLPELVDLDNLLHWQVQSTLAFSHSQRNSHNLIVYFNPEINKFQFLPWNVAMADQPPSNPDINYNPLMVRVLKNPDWMFQRNQILWQYVSQPGNLQEDLNYYDNLYQTSRGAFYRDPLRFFPSLDFDLRVKKFRQRIVMAQTKIKELLNQAQASLKLQPLTANTYYLQITSQGFASLQLNGFELNSQPVFPRLIKDANNNQLIDPADTELNLDQAIIHTQRDIQAFGEPFLLQDATQAFFLVFPTLPDNPDIRIDLINAITGDKVNYE